MAISGNVGGTFSIHDRRTVGINTAADIPVNWAPATVFTDGAGANQANILYQGSLVLTAGVYNFDLAGVLTDSFGTSIAMARVKALGFINNGTNIMTLGNHATAALTTWLGATSTMVVRPGGWFLISAPDATGYVVTASTADTIKIAGTGTDGFYIFVLGSST